MLKKLRNKKTAKKANPMLIPPISGTPCEIKKCLRTETAFSATKNNADNKKLASAAAT